MNTFGYINVKKTPNKQTNVRLKKTLNSKDRKLRKILYIWQRAIYRELSHKWEKEGNLVEE